MNQDTSTSASNRSTLLSDPDKLEQIKNSFKTIENVSKTLEEKSNLASDKIQEIIELIKKSGGSGSKQFLDNLMVLIQNIQEFVSSLSFLQTFTFLNIGIGLLILYSLLSLITIFYSDFLINYLNLENKYPKLGKFIKIRKKFQQYYFLLHVIIIIMLVFLLIYVNYLMFIVS